MVEEQNIIGKASKGNLKFAESDTIGGARGESHDCIYFYYNGVFHYRNGALEKAKEEFKKALSCNPDFFEARYDLGLLHRNSSEFSEAAECFAICSEAEPDNFEALFNYAYVSEKLKDYDTAEIHYLKAAELKPNSPETFYNLGNLYKEKREWKKARDFYTKAVELSPGNEKYYTNLGVSFHYLGKYDEAVSAFEKALELNPDFSEAKLNLAATLVELGKTDEAFAVYDELLKADPEDSLVRYDKALALLLNGDYRNGFKEYERRLKSEYYSSRYETTKFWKGEPLDGKTLLVIDEQGYGDFFQFVRYLKQLRKLNGKIALAVRPELKNFAEKQNFADEVISITNNYRADYKIFLLSLPLMLNEFNADFPYINVAENDSRDTEKRIGIIWRGSSEHMYDFKRTIPLEKFLKALNVKTNRFVSLQFDVTEEERELLESNNIEIPERDLLAFDNGAPALGNLELVISVDTAVAHFAAAAGKKVWLLLPQIPDWRWGLSGEKTFWYPTMKLFRQKSLNDWDGVLDEVKNSLKSEVAGINIELSVKKIEALEAIDKKEIDKGINLLLSLSEKYPDDYDVNFWLGHAYNSKKESKKAIEFFTKAAQIKPDAYNVKNLIGICEMEAGNFSSAEKHFKTVPEKFRSADIWNNLGFVLQSQRKLEEAEEMFLKAIELSPGVAGYFINLGNNYYYKHKFDEALDAFDKALEMESDFPAARVGKSFVYLMNRNFNEGFEEFKWTLDDYQKFMPPDAVKWNGEEIAGKRIFIYGEQGFGDVIQFGRFIPKVKELGCKIIFDCDDKLKPLFAGMEYIDEIKRGVEAKADYYASLLDLPRILKLSEEKELALPENLLCVDKEKRKYWRGKIDPSEFNVGIVWKTNPKNKTAAERSIPVEEIEPLLRLSGITFNVLQLDLTEKEIDFLNKFKNVRILSGEIKDFADTAAIIDNLDLAITVDTSLTHIAGTLGKETWLVPSAVSEWRWGAEGESSYWYPAVKIFRPEKPFEWKDTIEKITDELKKFSKKKNGKPEERLNLDYAKKLLDGKKYQEAITAFNKLVAKNNNDFEAHFYLGYTRQVLNDLEKAARNYANVLKIKPEHFNALNNLGVVLKDLGKFDEAVKFLSFAKTVNPDNASVYNNLGITLDLQGKFDEAILHFKKALELRANYYDAKLNLANTLQTLGEYDKAVALFDEIIKVNPNSVGANFNKALTLLSKGDYKNGFELYEWRAKREDYVNREFSKPLLNTFDVAGKTIFVYDEQGYGDTIQFGRFIKPLADMGARVILQCHNSLVDLMRGCEGVKEAIHRYSYKEPLVDYDCHIPLLSLPRYLNVDRNTLPAETPYISIDADKTERFGKTIGEANIPKIGIVWKGKTPVGNAHRSCPVDYFTELAETYSNAVFYSLQIDLSENEREKIAKAGIIDLSGMIETFSDTAAIIKNMDLIITIDTSVAHLAGALNAKTFTILSYKNDWRWKPETENSIWYPAMKLIRQETFGDWKKIFEKINFLLIDFEKDFVNG